MSCYRFDLRAHGAKNFAATRTKVSTLGAWNLANIIEWNATVQCAALTFASTYIVHTCCDNDDKTLHD